LTPSSLIVQLREKVNHLPKTVPLATKTHILAAYNQSPENLTNYIQDDAEIWESWDRTLNMLLQHNPDNMKQLVVRGKFGLKGLVDFFEHLVRDRNLDERLLDGKVKWILDAIDMYIHVHFFRDVFY